MASGKRISSDQVPQFSSGTRERRKAQRAEPRAVEDPSRKPKNNDAGSGFDPYNTSGSFDRRKHWERVGKR
jgi:hypothetical protein